MKLNLINAKTLAERFRAAFIAQDRWKLYLKGIENTLIISLMAVAIGITLGFIIATVTYVRKKTGKLRVLAAIFKVYVTVIRGTPVVLQLFIMYFVVLTFVKSGVIVGAITFGLNSAAYVAEIARAGFGSVDDGQMEAGRSLGLSGAETMGKIILPQAMKNALPPLFNEFISLVKETAVVGYVGIIDLGKVPGLVQSRTFDYLFPLLISSVIYLAMVMLLTFVLRLMEKRLARSERNGGLANG
ncbi:MAG: amino acid ABC transporter permease [Clostridia bacterium]|nr:amino acid ABC transporter permease [Clostridia bacterium]